MVIEIGFKEIDGGGDCRKGLTQFLSRATI